MSDRKSDYMLTSNVPLIATDGDRPRARRTDPVASHIAADRSSKTRQKIRDAVLEVLDEDGPMTGGEMNEAFRVWRESNRATFPRCHFDSPRKRLGELADDSLVDVVTHLHGTVEAVYAISVVGRASIGRDGRTPDEREADLQADLSRVERGLPPLHGPVTL